MNAIALIVTGQHGPRFINLSHYAALEAQQVDIVLPSGTSQLAFLAAEIADKGETTPLAFCRSLDDAMAVLDDLVRVVSLKQIGVDARKQTYIPSKEILDILEGMVAP